MEKKTFYTIYREDRVTGVKKHSGFEIEVRGWKLNAYVAVFGTVYVCDPYTGLCIYQYEPDESVEGDERAAIKQVEERLARNYFVIDKWAGRRRAEDYELKEHVFKSFKCGARLQEALERQEREERELAYG